MTFDAIAFFQHFGIDYKTEGHKHCRIGWAQIKCPFCFGNDGWHLGFELERGWWSCWRCGFHRTWDVLLALLGSRSLAMQAMRDFNRLTIATPNKKAKYAKKLILPTGLQSLTKRARKYLESRNFNPDLLELFWKLQSTGITGPLKYRIYIPIDLDGRTVTWQCRDVTGKSRLRYISQSQDKELVNNKETLYGVDLATGRSCVVVEGVADVWRLGPGAVATFGIKYKPAQVAMLLRRFDQFHILFDPPDPQAQIQAQKLAQDLAVFGKKVKVWTPDTDLDPGDMPQDEADAFMRDVLGKTSGY